MSDVTRLMQAAGNGDARAARDLLPLVYDELRKLAAQRMAQERPDHTLQATALVHDAYLRLVDVPHSQKFDGRGHFFAAAAEAMRRILIEEARRKQSLKRGGNLQHELLEPEKLQYPSNVKPVDDLLALDDALKKLSAEDPRKAELVKLRYFAGLTLAEASQVLNISHNTADRWWAYAKAFLYDQINSAKAD